MIEITVRSCSRDLLSRRAAGRCTRVQDGKWTINYDPKDRNKPISEWLKPQGRFKHLIVPGNEALLAKFQRPVDDGKA